MAHQRRGERPRHLGRLGGRMGGLGAVLLTLLVLATGCEGGTPVAPGNALPPDDGTVGSGGGKSAAELIIGTWQTTVVLTVPESDYLTTVTTWAFQADDSCRQIIESRLFSEGVTHTTLRSCTYRLNQGVVLVQYDGAVAEVPYPFTFPLNNQNVLILSGLAYERLS